MSPFSEPIRTGRARLRQAIVPVSDLRPWRDGIESLNPAKTPCSGLYGEAWQKMHANMLDRFSAQAQDLGWTDLDLFGVHPVIGTSRVDHCGALTLATKPAEWMDAAHQLRQHELLPGQARDAARRADLGVQGVS